MTFSGEQEMLKFLKLFSRNGETKTISINDLHDYALLMVFFKFFFSLFCREISIPMDDFYLYPGFKANTF
jgi:hypothetical protein